MSRRPAQGQGPRHVAVAGATGLVGGELVRLLDATDDIRVTALVRSLAPGRFPPRVAEQLFDFENERSYRALGERGFDALFCCLGTTRATAGSDEAFRRVDRDYPLALLATAQGLARPAVFGLVSSVGAEQSRGLYLGTKAEVEQAVRSSGVPYVIVRPSLLRGQRGERRVAERLAIGLARPLELLARSWETAARYAPILASDVARALAQAALGPGEPHLVLEGADLRRAGQASGPTGR
jgi:uncharacterized protein YbjT (DUF2867 family)